MLISIILLTWNRFKFLDACLTSLLANLSGRFDYEILILDNGSTDQTADVLSKYEHLPNVTVIKNTCNEGLKAYKKLFNRARGEYLIEVDDDILRFPKGFDQTIITYLDVYRDYGFLALNVVQDSHTNGAKPDASCYVADVRQGMTVENGPTGGWCSGFRRRDYRKIRFFFNLIPLSMRRCEDGMLCTLFKFLLRLKAGIIKDAVCLHACGPYYAKLYGQTAREIEKYLSAGLTDIAHGYTEDAETSPSS